MIKMVKRNNSQIKTLGILFIILCALLCLSSCKDNSNDTDKPLPSGNEDNDILIAYFSCTNTTKTIAERINNHVKGTLHQIVPEVPYTEADLKYYSGGRADLEQADSSARPLIKEKIDNIDKYKVIFIGYPIWHGQAPRIISTFLESYDFSGKTIIPFCTSSSSGIGSSDTFTFTC